MLVRLVKPNRQLLASYLEALGEGPYCNMALGGFGDESAHTISEDPDAYIEKVTSTGKRNVKLSDGSEFEIKEHELFWIADDERFLGTLSVRYKGDVELMENVAGHVGMAIRPGLLNRGFGVMAAREVWKLIPDLLAKHGVDSVIVTCDRDNRASRRLIEHNGGVLVGQNDDCHGMGPNLIFKIEVARAPQA